MEKIINLKLAALDAALHSPTEKLHYQSPDTMTDTYCPNFTYLGHLFTLLELEDQNETIFISDDTDYIVTRVENAWLMHHVHDNEPVMFGLIPHSAKGIFIVKTLK